ncbi:MAG: hypothetical protein GY929_11925 [Actinomycetia bacterium]|nr:hypothetical protein [Actinomycetes bacterium]
MKLRPSLELVMREPSADERERGTGVRPPEPAARDELPAPLAGHQLDFGAHGPNVEGAAGPAVSWSGVVSAIGVEIDRRR